MTPVDPDDLMRRLRASLAAEIEQQAGQLNDDLLLLEGGPDDRERLRSVFRVFHTLKGAARAAGVGLVEQVCHRIEDRLLPIRDGKAGLAAEDFALLFATADALNAAAHDLTRTAAPTLAPLHAILAQLKGAVPSAEASIPITTPPATPAPVSREQLRIETRRLDSLVDITGDLLTLGTRVQLRASELGDLHESTTRWWTNWQAFGAKLRRVALEPRRELLPNTEQHVLVELEERIRRLVRSQGNLVQRMSGEIQTLQDAIERLSNGVHALRMHPFSTVCEALPRVMRDVAGASGRTAALVLEGGEVTADRAVLEALRDPLVQLLRNAVDHGIESPEQRAAAGKPATGTVRISAALQQDRLLVTVTDDGMGLDILALRSSAESRGLDVPENDHAVAALLFQGRGISSKSTASELSGRGIGLDIVRTAAERLGGTVDVEWRPGEGTTFRLDLPVSLATWRVVLAQIGPHPVAIPTRLVERLMRISSTDLTEVQGQQVLPTSEGAVPLVSLAAVLGAPYQPGPVSGATPAILVAVSGRRMAFTVDALLDEREVVVRAADAEWEQIPFASGITLLADGALAPVLQMPAIVAAALGPARQPVIFQDQAGDGDTQRARILVVDDSITTRTLEASLLEAAGYEVETAVDGADAWRRLQERGADLVVADVEMPRMDGFALCEAIRNSQRFRELPVVLVTARESPEDRARGLEVGATAYVGKSGFDQQQLLEIIADLLE